MTLLVADVGGTNTRLGLFAAGGLCNVTRYQNDSYASFDAVVQDFLSKASPAALSGAVIAVAGPVNGAHAALTNRDWSFDRAALSSALPGAPPVHLINDLAALGHALPALAEGHRSSLLAGTTPLDAAQRLVVGMGTGFNVCLLRAGVVVEAELGHASLPSRVAAILNEALGPKAAGFATNEALLSGRGLSALHQALSGQVLAGPEIVAAGPSCVAANQTLQVMIQTLGVFARELVFQYMPLGGIYFAGGAARGILGSDASPSFASAFLAPGPFQDQMTQVPVHVIQDDQAALIGAARYFGKG